MPSLMQSISIAVEPSVVLIIVLATVFGAIIGALPGFSSIMAVSLLLPVFWGRSTWARCTATPTRLSC